MSSFPNSPRVVKGGLVLIDPASAQVQRVIALQYNPDTLPRTLQAQHIGDGAERSEALRLKGPAVETLKLEAEIDATDQLEFPDQNKVAIEAGIAPERLIVFERDVALHRLLSSRFPHVTVLLGDVVRLRSQLRRQGVGAVDAVVSGLPLLPMSERLQRIILNQAFAVMDEDGVFVQFTYGPGSPISRAKLERWSLQARQAGYSWRNVPPASVWRLTKASAMIQREAS